MQEYLAAERLGVNDTTKQKFLDLLGLLETHPDDKFNIECLVDIPSDLLPDPNDKTLCEKNLTCLRNMGINNVTCCGLGLLLLHDTGIEFNNNEFVAFINQYGVDWAPFRGYTGLAYDSFFSDAWVNVDNTKQGLVNRIKHWLTTGGYLLP